jgi:hypothetical protein
MSLPRCPFDVRKQLFLTYGSGHVCFCGNFASEYEASPGGNQRQERPMAGSCHIKTSGKHLPPSSELPPLSASSECSQFVLCFKRPHVLSRSIAISSGPWMIKRLGKMNHT